jgi:shikimate dehydrogenase
VRAITGSTRVCCVIGDPVEHSRSPQMHNAAYEALRLDRVYVALRVAPASLGTALAGLAALGVDACNVTIPHKQAALEHCATLSPDARAAGAVNTLLVAADGGLHGHQTDGPGLVAALQEQAPQALRLRALVLGAGGSARAAAAALLAAGVPSVAVVARRPEAARALAAGLEGAVAAERVEGAYGALVNCTPVGGLTALQELPLAADALDEVDAVCDYAYRADAEPTALVAAARRRGLVAVDGLELLVRQGALAFELVTGLEAPLEVMRTAVRGDA